MLTRNLRARLAARWYPSTRSNPTAAERLRRAVAEVLEDRRLFTVLPTFAPGATYITGQQPRSVVSIDLNSDGNLDFLTSDTVSGTVTTRMGRGDGTFRPANTITVGTDPICAAVADFNSDNKLDFAVALAGTDEVAVYLGAGDGATFAKSGAFATGDLFISPGNAFGTGAKVIARDFDGDGKMDLTVTNPAAATVSVLLGQNNGQFGARVVTNLSPSFALVGIASRDFNADGKADLVITGNGDVTILFATTGGNFTLSQRFTSQETSLSDVHDAILGDVTGDGIVDLAVVSGDLDRVTVFKGAAGGTFSVFTTAGVGLEGAQDRGPVALVIADFNKDGSQDIAVANLTYGSYTVLANDGTGHFPFELEREVPVYPQNDEGSLPDPSTLNFARPYDIGAGDYNNDGKVDLITASEGNVVTLILNNTGSASIHQPTIDSFTVSPDPAQVDGGPITLSVTASEVGGSINRVQFYMETNGTPDLQAGDQTLGYADYANGVWTGTIGSTRPPGTYKLYAVATDSFGQSVTGIVTFTQFAGTALSIADASTSEGNSGTTNLTFTVTRSGDVSGVTTVTYETAAGLGTATANDDYTAIAPTTLTFNAGETTKSITVAVKGDTTFENSEYFYVQLSNASNASLADPVATGQILNDDAQSGQNAPAAPSGLSGQAVSPTQINLSWTDNATNETAIEVQRSLVYNFQSPTNVTVNGSNLTTYSDTTLSQNTYYYFRVRTVNAAGASAWSSSVKIKTIKSGTVTPPPTVPAIPAAPSASANSTSQITVSWTDASSNETGFRIRRSTSSDFSTFTDFTVGANTTSFTDSGLAANTTYYYMVQSFNGTGPSIFTGSVNAKTLANTGGTGPLTAPNGLAGVVGQTTVALNWNDNSSNETKWEIQISTVYNFQPGTTVTVTGADVENYTVQSLNSYTWYYFRVRAVNDTNVSAWSSSVKLKTLR